MRNRFEMSRDVKPFWYFSVTPMAGSGSAFQSRIVARASYRVKVPEVNLWFSHVLTTQDVGLSRGNDTVPTRGCDTNSGRYGLTSRTEARPCKCRHVTQQKIVARRNERNQYLVRDRVREGKANAYTYQSGRHLTRRPHGR